MAASEQDSGYAWVVCAASFMVMVIKGGFVFTAGMFYIMFQNGLEADNSALALITSLNISFHYLVCPAAGLLAERFGERRIAMIGAGLATLGYATSSLSTDVYQLYITFGLTAGVGLGMSFNPSVAILSKYFIRHRRSACGLALCGLGVGSFIFPPALKALEDAYGWRGAVLLMAGISAHSLVFCALFRPITEKKEESVIYVPSTDDIVKETIHREIKQIKHDAQKSEETQKFEVGNNNDPPNDPPKHYVKQVLSLFRIVPFFCLSLHSLLVFFPMFIVYTHFGSYALTLGFTSKDVVLLYMAMGITSTITRAMIGVLSQVTKVNASGLVMASTIILAACTTALPLTHRLSLMYTYAVAFQVLMAPYNILCSVIVMDSVPKKHVPSGYGIVCFFDVPGTTFGPPLAAWLYERTTVYAHSFYLAGGLFLLAGLSMIPAALSMHKQAKEDARLATYKHPETTHQDRL